MVDSEFVVFCRCICILRFFLYLIFFVGVNFFVEKVILYKTSSYKTKIHERTACLEKLDRRKGCRLYVLKNLMKGVQWLKKPD